MIAQTVLLLLLIVSYPFWERYEIGTLKDSTEPDARVKSYRRTILYQWGVALVLALLVGPRTLARPPAALAGVSGPTSEFLVTAAPALLAGLLAPVLLAKSNPALRKKREASFASIAYYLPRTGRERALFALVCVTAGVCEEIIFRGWIIRYLAALPAGLTLWGSLGVSAALFGLVHLYQGWRGVALTAVLGGLLGFLFLNTGSLIVPIVLHVLIDLRALLLMPRTAAVGAESAGGRRGGEGNADANTV